MDLEQRLANIEVKLYRLRDRLLRLGYRFREPDQTLPGPDSDVLGALERLNAGVGPIPKALAIFYCRIGSINFLGNHPEWQGSEFPDPVFVYPVSVALDEMREYLENREEYTSAFGSFRIPVAPDLYHKENVSGGTWYGVASPQTIEDPLLLAEWHETTFCGYLEEALRWGGFPGLEKNAKTHSWPLADLLLE